LGFGPASPGTWAGSQMLDPLAGSQTYVPGSLEFDGGSGYSAVPSLSITATTPMRRCKVQDKARP
jgi:hypothetical protein